MDAATERTARAAILEHRLAALRRLRDKFAAIGTRRALEEASRIDASISELEAA